jgi:hypothetical protein
MPRHSGSLRKESTQLPRRPQTRLRPALVPPGLAIGGFEMISKLKGLKAGKWHIRFNFLPFFIECPCGNGFVGVRSPNCTCGA